MEIEAKKAANQREMTSGAGEGSEDGSEKNVKQENVDSANVSTEVRLFKELNSFENVCQKPSILKSD